MIAAIVPAAGASRRMGRPKLLLPIEGVSVLARVVSALRAGGVDHVVVVTPPSVVAESAALQREAASAGAHDVVVPDHPLEDMRASVEQGLAALARRDEPPGAVVLTPADSPRLSAAIVATLLTAWRSQPEAILVPTWKGRRGHPLVLPWAAARSIPALRCGVGVNALLSEPHARLVELASDDPGVTTDLDTPADYEQLTGHRADV